MEVKRKKKKEVKNLHAMKTVLIYGVTVKGVSYD